MFRMRSSHSRKFLATNSVVVSVVFFSILTGSALIIAAYAQGTKENCIVRVRVTDRETETPLEQVRVEILKFPSGNVGTAFTDATGRVEFTVEPDTYVVRATYRAYQDAEVMLDILPGRALADASVAMERSTTEKNAAPGQVSARALSLPAGAVDNFKKGVESLQSKKDAKLGLEFLQKAVGLAPDYYEAYFMQGMAYVQLSSPKEAEGAFRKAIELKPDFLSPRYPLALILFGQKRYDEEEHVLQEAMEQDGRGWQWPFELARCSALRGQWDKAIEYGRIAGQKPNAPSKVHLLMGDLYSNAGRTEEAISELEQFAKTDPKSPYMPKVEKALAKLRGADLKAPAQAGPH